VAKTVHCSLLRSIRFLGREALFESVAQSVEQRTFKTIFPFWIQEILEKTAVWKSLDGLNRPFEAYNTPPYLKCIFKADFASDSVVSFAFSDPDMNGSGCRKLRECQQARTLPWTVAVSLIQGCRLNECDSLKLPCRYAVR
jgi:hypothetical protein